MRLGRCFLILSLVSTLTSVASALSMWTTSCPNRGCPWSSISSPLSCLFHSSLSSCTSIRLLMARSGHALSCSPMCPLLGRECSNHRLTHSLLPSSIAPDGTTPASANRPNQRRHALHAWVHQIRKCLPTFCTCSHKRCAWPSGQDSSSESSG